MTKLRMEGHRKLIIGENEAHDDFAIEGSEVKVTRPINSLTTDNQPHLQNGKAC